jgi:hypothetical protein
MLSVTEMCTLQFFHAFLGARNNHVPYFAIDNGFEKASGEILEIVRRCSFEENKDELDIAHIHGICEKSNDFDSES